MWCVRINIFSWFGVNWENVDSLHVHTGRQFSPPVYLLRVSSRPRHDKLTRNQIWPSRRRQGIEVVYKCIPPARNFQLSPWLDWEKKKWQGSRVDDISGSDVTSGRQASFLIFGGRLVTNQMLVVQGKYTTVLRAVVAASARTQCKSCQQPIA